MAALYGLIRLPETHQKRDSARSSQQNNIVRKRTLANPIMATTPLNSNQLSKDVSGLEDRRQSSLNVSSFIPICLFVKLHSLPTGCARLSHLDFSCILIVARCLQMQQVSALACCKTRVHRDYIVLLQECCYCHCILRILPIHCSVTTHLFRQPAVVQNAAIVCNQHLDFHKGNNLHKCPFHNGWPGALDKHGDNF